MTSEKEQNILFLGIFYPRNLLRTVKEDSKGKVGFSTHNFEMSILHGLIAQDGLNLRCLTVPGVYSFPHNNKKIYTHSESYNVAYINIKSVGFCNFVIINKIWMTISLFFNLLYQLKQYKGKRIDVIVNSPVFYLLFALHTAKRFVSKEITITLIIPDIPAFVSAMDKQNYIKKYLLGYINRKSMIMAEKSDHMVLLTKAMMDFFNKPVDHIVMEGLIDVGSMDVMNDKISNDSEKKIVLYTGTLRKIFGVMNLVEAFEKANLNNTELWICGSGNAAAELEQKAQTNPNIKYLGLLDSREVLKIQHKATVLVNPRTSEGEYTKYSFPSKTLEYLLTGKTVIINRIPGIPDEYFDYVFTPKDESIESLAEELTKVICLSEEEREKRAAAGRQFVLTHKNAKVQVSRIIKMIEGNPK